MKATEIFSVYSWLGETFRRHGELTLHELNELWVKTEMSGGVPMSRHTFTRHRQSMQEMFGFNIVCHKRTNSYSIADDDLHLHKTCRPGCSKRSPSATCSVKVPR